jgi:hypothetical protein
MPFKTAVLAYLASIDSDSDDYRALDYLVKNALGSSKSKGWPKIKEFAGIDTEEYKQHDFQNGVLALSRQNKFFICSNNKGYYIPENENDIKVAKQYYESRIETMLTNLKHLRTVAIEGYPAIEFKSVEAWLEEVVARLQDE